MRRLPMRRRAMLALLLAAPVGLADPAAAQPPPAAPRQEAGVAVSGPGGSAVLDAAALAALPQTRAELVLGAEHGPGTRAVFEGPALWAVLGRSGALQGVRPPQEVRGAVVVAGRDGYAAVLSLGEIAPDLGGRPVVLALRMDGQPLPPGGLRLVVPGEGRAGRSVRDVASVAVTLLGTGK